jgi:hypothetical protein
LFSDSHPYQYAILDRDAKFGAEIGELLKANISLRQPTGPATSTDHMEPMTVFPHMKF